MLMRLFFRLSTVCAIPIALLIITLRLIAPTLPTSGQLTFVASDTRLGFFTGIYLFDVGRGVSTLIYRDDRILRQIAWHPDSEQLLVISERATIRLLDANTGKVLWSFNRINPQVVISFLGWVDEGSSFLFALRHSDTLERRVARFNLIDQDWKLLDLPDVSLWQWMNISDDKAYFINWGEERVEQFNLSSQQFEIIHAWDGATEAWNSVEMSRDGTQVWVSSVQFDSDYQSFDILLLDVESRAMIDLDQSESEVDDAPVWTHAMDALIFSSYDYINNDLHLYQLRLKTGEREILYTAAQPPFDTISYVDVSSDDGWVSFVEDTGSSKRICLIDRHQQSMPNCPITRDFISIVVWRPE